MKNFLNRIIAISCCFALMTGSLLEAALNTTPNITQETTVKLITVDRLRSGTDKKGDRVKYIVDEDVLDEAGHILIKKGTAAFGKVLNSRGAGSWGRRGALDVSVEYTTAVDGQKIGLTATKGKRGGGDKGLVTAGVLLCPLLFAIPIGMSRGSNVTIEPGTTFVAYADDSVFVNYNASSNQGTVVNTSNTMAAPIAINTDTTNIPTSKITLTTGQTIEGKILNMAGNTCTVQTDFGILQLETGKISNMAIKTESESKATLMPVDDEDAARDERLKNLKNRLKK